MKKKQIIFTAGLILGLLLLALLSFLLIHFSKKTGSYVTVRVNGEIVEEIPLSKNGEYILNGGTNVLVVTDGQAYMKEAACPDHICMKMGEIRAAGESITCLPNKLTVTVGE